MLRSLFHLLEKNNKLIILVFLGSLSWSLTMIRSGINGQFWGANAHDGLWHIALTNSLAKGSFEMPVFAGEQLQNYHIGYDLLSAVVHNITGVSVFTLYFQIFPIILSVLIGLLTYTLVLKWKESKASALWATFFTYFAGSWAWLFGKQDSMFWSQQSITTLINPPYALSLVFILLGLISLVNLLRSNNQKFSTFIIPIIFFGLLSQIKIYGYLLILGGLLVTSLWELIVQKSYRLLIVFAGTLLLGLAVYLPTNSLSTSTLIIQPFWFLETMMLFPDRVGWIAYYDAMRNSAANDQYLLAIAVYSFAALIFILGNLGSRLVSAIYFIKSLWIIKKIDLIAVIFIAVIGAGIVMPMIFVQSGTAWNTIQFFYYSLFFAGILSGVSMKSLNKHKFIPVVFVLLTIPTSIHELRTIYITHEPQFYVSSAELEALEFLKKQPDGVVLTYPVEHSHSKAYVSAYGDKNVYLEDEINLNIMNYEWTSRRKGVENFFDIVSPDSSIFLQNNNISYLYLPKSSGVTINQIDLGLEKIYENEEVDVYKVIR